MKVTDNIDERACFLYRLRLRHPAFWESLNRLWREWGRQGIPEGHLQKALEIWFRHQHVVDDWLKLACEATVCAWSEDPDGPAARLDPTHHWYADNYLSGEAEPFRPEFSKPYPTNSDPDLSNLEQRMREQFESQWKDYKRRHRETFGNAGAGQTPLYADLTALAFGGQTDEHIADESEWRDVKESADPVQFVKTSIRRFSEKIGLTLPPRSGNVKTITRSA